MTRRFSYPDGVVLPYASGETPELGDEVELIRSSTTGERRIVIDVGVDHEDGAGIAITLRLDGRSTIPAAFPPYYRLIRRRTIGSVIAEAREHAPGAKRVDCVVCDDLGCEHCPKVDP